MKLKSALILMFMLISSACANQSAFSRTAIEKKRIEIAERVTLDDVITTPDLDSSHKTMLGHAAYEMTKGAKVGQAVQMFKADGATCVGATCTWAYRDREPMGVLIFSGIRPPGPRRTFGHLYQVTITSDVVTKRSDITVQIWHRDVTTVQ